MVSEGLHIESEAGLTSEQAAERLAQFGPNEPSPERRSSRVLQLLTLFLNPLVVILLIASIVSAFVGQYIDAAIIVTIVLLGIAIDFVQTYRSQRAADRLREQVAPTATVLRDGHWREIRRREIVPGDLIRLSAGDLIPADAQLSQATHLYIQQAALTGESIPAEKDPKRDQSPTTGGPERCDLVFLGTSVVSGTAIARVLATGSKTQFGDIARRLTVRPEETEFERGIRQFGALIMRTVFFLVLFIVVVSIALHREPFESLLFAVALAVGLTPEFLPMITSVTLARGAVRMAQRKVIVKQLAAIQNLGSIDILCSDKTGTRLPPAKWRSTVRLIPSDRLPKRYSGSRGLNSKFQTGIRSPLDTTILAHAQLEIGPWEKCDEIPFDFERRRLSIVVQRPADSGSECLLITKGSPEGIIEIAATCKIGSRLIPMDDSTRTQCRTTYDELSARGLVFLQ